MSNSTTLKVKINNADPFYIISIVEKELEDLIYPLASKLNRGRSNEDNNLPESIIKPSKICNVYFSYKGEHRKLFIWFQKKEVYFNLSAWGNSEFYMEKIRDKFIKEGYIVEYKAFE